MDRAANLGDVNLAVTRGLLGNRTFGSAKIAIGSATAKVKTVAAIDYTIDGMIYTLAATDDFFVHTDLTVQPAASTKYYALCVDAAGAGSIIAGPNTLTAAITTQTNKAAMPVIPDTKCLVGVIKVVTVGSTFVPATTAHTGITTYYNVSAVPSTGIPA